MAVRERVEVEGIVQGVGFRPFVYRLALTLRLSGWVRNTGRGVRLEVEGNRDDLDLFRRALTAEAPPLAVISRIDVEEIAAEETAGFAILPSAGEAAGGDVAPDCDVCDDCLGELFDPGNRRHLYPFINCTNCGPRYSIITGIPYDRPATTMASFSMCGECLAEYRDPLNRRFHAQPNACPECGPQLVLAGASGERVPGDPLQRAIAALQGGSIVAVKGVGGYHLAVDARNGEAVARLRQRKKRDEKPFALLMEDLAAVREVAACDELEARLLRASERPILLLRKLEGNRVSRHVAPGNGWLGVMLPGNPLQHLLARGFDAPLVMTSGNLSDEPIAYRDAEALTRLSGIADLFLLHDREIRVRSDDSVIRLHRGEPLFIRRSRGHAPRAVALPAPQKNLLAVGGELKGTICLTRGAQAFLSQHIGDLKNVATLASLEETAAHLGRLLEIRPEAVAHDQHPDYLSTRYAEQLGLKTVPVQHHHAHMASCMAEHGLEGDAIGVVLDGSGYGPDGNVWGGEFLVGGYGGFRRRGHFSYLRMPGGDAAVREPYRMALSALHQLYGPELFRQDLPFSRILGPQERSLFLKMLERGINSPLTSSCGRLFDAVAALLGVRNSISYEGQAAIELEALAEQGTPSDPYPFLVAAGACPAIDMSPAFAAMHREIRDGRSRADIARAFHRTIAGAVREMCRRIGAECGIRRVVLSGGVFQNRLLSEEVAALLEAERFQLHCHRLVPPNDGGLALGQAVIAGRLLAGG